MTKVGELIKAQRAARKWSLRRLAGELGVTPAYVADLEAGRRLPSQDLGERLSKVLEISSDDLAAADSRLTPDLRDWIEERPELTALLRGVRNAPMSDALIQRLTRFFTRRVRPAQAEPPRGTIVTWESELRAIAADACAWSVETGGDLFGRWNETPAVLLATKAGPKAKRDHAHFRLDVEYLREISEVLANDWALRYFGDWHSHHRLGLSSPSGGDRRRILSVAARNQFLGMAEIIVTLEDSRGEQIVRIHPWIYDLSSTNTGPYSLQLKVLPGISPVREALIARKALPAQDLQAWEKVPLQRVRVGSDTEAPTLEPMRDVDLATREITLSHLIRALQEASGAPVEQHPTGFGSVLVARLEGARHLAFAFGAAWPMQVLEVHELDRATGSTEVLDGHGKLVALDVPGIVAAFVAARSRAPT